jgi:hypothetical protein
MKGTNRRKKAGARKSSHKIAKLNTEPMSPFSLVERRLQGRKFVEFPQMKGKTLDKVEIFTAPEYHSIKMDFQDSTSLALKIEPCFTVHATLFDITRGELVIREEWLPVHSATNPH